MCDHSILDGSKVTDIHCAEDLKELPKASSKKDHSHPQPKHGEQKSTYHADTTKNAVKEDSPSEIGGKTS